MNATTVTKEILPIRVITTNLRDGVRTLLDTSEQQIEGFGRQVDAVAKRFEKRTHRQVGQVKKQLSVGQTWLKQQIGRLKEAESKAETAIEASRIMMHFVQKDAREMWDTYRVRYAKACSKIASIHGKDSVAQKKSQRNKKAQKDVDGIPLADKQA